MHACQYGRYDIVQMLLDKMNNEVDMHVRDHGYKRTAFMWACCYDYDGAELVRLLLERCHKDIDLDLTDRSGKTAYMLAKESKNEANAKLISNYCRVKCENK